MECSEGTGLQVAGVTTYTFGHGADQWDVWVFSPRDTMIGAHVTAGPLPVLYVTDPSATFLVTMSVAQTLLTLSHGTLAPFAIVGVGPRTDELERLFSQRVRDLTPTANPSADADPRYPSGGSRDFLDLLLNEVAPVVESRHDLDPSQRGVAGLSLGGLFCVTSLLERPEAFQRLLTVSPAVLWDDHVVLDRLQKLAPGALAGTKAYVAVGEHESDGVLTWPGRAAFDEAGTGAQQPPDMVADALLLGELLERAGAEVVVDTIADEHHNTIWAAAVTRGIIELYGT